MGAPPGDLYIVTDVKPHSFFDRRGDDLYTIVPITVTEATLGAKIEVPDDRRPLAGARSSGNKQRQRLCA